MNETISRARLTRAVPDKLVRSFVTKFVTDSSPDFSGDYQPAENAEID